MKRLIFLMILALALSVQAFAHQAFTLVSSEKKSVKASELATLEKSQTMGKKEASSITFSENEIRLVVLTGPEDDMLSYRIQGIRNPTLIVPSGATLKVLFVNVDTDMRHDVRFGHVMTEFGSNPDTTDTAGAEKLPPESDGTTQAQELVLKANEDGAYKYFCSVGSHAKGGMWGNITVGIKPAGDMKMPAKTQHVHSPNEDKAPEVKADAPKKPGEMPGMDHDHGDKGMQMSSVTSIGDPMQRESSGTAWAPDSSPVYARMKMTESGGMWMFMGTAFLRYTEIGSSRDVSAAGKGSRAKFDLPTMLMAMYSHPIGKGSQFGFRAMASLDPVFEQRFGYPLLYQSGEQFRGEPLHDRQHPHDLISEMAVTFSRKFSDKSSFFIYAGYPGEPALGPPMYLHRTSGMNNPDAPISHHWQDATHITYGVVTAGFSLGRAKIEASAFNGTEPNENRWNFDKPRLNSFSGRFTINPTKNLSLQISHGYLKNPEPLEPEIRILRKTTASAIYNKKLDDDRNWASTFVWGQNYANGERSNSFLFESNYDFSANAVFGRFETVKKSGHDLVLDPPLDHTSFWVSALSAGYIRDIVHGKGIDVGLGGMATLNHNPAALAAVYGGTRHGGWQIFMRFRPTQLP
ncbi:MAG: plastocyanin/azurin family copper-binding protein [Acidobacteriota bacterium]